VRLIKFLKLTWETKLTQCPFAHEKIFEKPKNWKTIAALSVVN